MIASDFLRKIGALTQNLKTYRQTESYDLYEAQNRKLIVKQKVMIYKIFNDEKLSQTGKLLFYVNNSDFLNKNRITNFVSLNLKILALQE